MSATDPQPHDAPDEGPRPQDLKRGGRKVIIAFVILVVLVAIAGALSNLGGDDPSGGREQGMGGAVTEELDGGA